MSNLTVAIRDEIRRLARKEIKAAGNSTRQVIAQYRREVATLKRQVKAQQKQIINLKSNSHDRMTSRKSGDEGALMGVRFSARSVRAQRRRLGLSMVSYAKLLGVSPLTIYFWESGRSRPRSAQLAALVAIRGIGKREATKRLAAVDAAADSEEK